MTTTPTAKGSSVETSRRPQSLDVQAWTVRRLVDAIRGIGTERIFIPSFQRSFVWKSKLREDFLRSIKECNPIGSLLFYDAGIKNGKQQFEIVDGLQRSTTLIRYEQDVFRFFRSDDVDDEFIASLLDTLEIAMDDPDERRLVERRLRNAVAAWVRERISFSSQEGFRVASLLETVERTLHYKTLATRPGILDLIQQCLDDFRSQLDVSEYKIPVVIFSGERAVLPEIFEKLNTRGVKLNKFDILAGAWNNKTVKLSHDVLVGAIRNRIVALSKGDVERISPNRRDGEYELYDAACAIGNLLVERYPELFHRKKKTADQAEPASCGFNVMALSFGLSLNEIEKIPGHLEQFGSEDDYFIAILQAAEEVKAMLGPTIAGSFAGSLSWKSEHAHTELQMASIVASAFRATAQIGPGAYASEIDRKRFTRQQYIFDALRNEWSGTGDSKAVHAVNQDRYASPVTKTNFMSSAHAWYGEHLEEARFRSALKSVWIDASTMAFLRAYLVACGVHVEGISGKIRSDVAIPEVSILSGSPLIVSNCRLSDENGHVLADPGAALPKLEPSPSADRLRYHLEQRFNVMLDKIALTYQFPEHA